MRGAPVADRINGLPFETWLRAEDLAQALELPFAEAAKVLRAGRRQGSITVTRRGEELLFMRVRRHTLPGARQQAASAAPLCTSPASASL